MLPTLLNGKSDGNVGQWQHNIDPILTYHFDRLLKKSSYKKKAKRSYHDFIVGKI